MLKELIELEKQHPELITKDSPTQRVGSEPLEGFNKVDHLTPMLSLENAFNTKDLEDFNKRILERLISETKVNFSCEPKLDGIAVNLIYKKGFLHQATTRGDGKIGEDITHNIRTVSSIPLSFKILVVRELFKILFASALPLASILTFSASFLADSSLNSYSKDICS